MNVQKKRRDNKNEPSVRSVVRAKPQSEKLPKDILLFQKKILKIEKLEASNKILSEDLNYIQAHVAEITGPLITKYCQVKLDNLSALEFHLGKKLLSSKETEKVLSLILDGANQLYTFFSDDRGKALYNKYVGADEYKIKDELDLASSPEVSPLSQEGEDWNGEDLQGTPQASQESEPIQFSFFKDLKPKTHQEKIELDFKLIYRNLMKVLHPDLELNEKKKDEKGQVTQQVVEAFKTNNVYELLKLRSQYLNSSVSDEDIILYSKELNKRIKELEYERYSIKCQFKGFYDCFYSRSKKKAQEKIEAERVRLLANIQDEMNLQKIYLSRDKLKSYLANIS